MLRTSRRPPSRKRERKLAPAWGGLCLLGLACTGSVGELGPELGVEPSGQAGAGGTTRPNMPTGTGGGTGMTPGGSPMVSTPGQPKACTVPSWSAGPARRLTAQEYRRTVRDLLGASASVTDALNLPDDTAFNHFDNYVGQQIWSAAHVDRYATAARLVARDAMSTDPRRAQLVGCTPAGADRVPCLRRFAEAFGRRAYRRPLTPAEVDEVLVPAAAVAADPDPWAGPRVLVEAMLQAPDFLYQIEVGTADPARPGVVRLNGYEVATRLSFLLLGRGPDDALLTAAGAGMLDTAAGVRTAATTLLASPKAAERTRDFFGQWLGLTDVADMQRDAKKFPLWNDDLRRSMVEETARLVSATVEGDAPLLDILTSQQSFVDGRLAALYGMTKPAADWTRTPLPANHDRSGLLTHAGILTYTARAITTAAVHRGLYVRERLLCQTPPPPPPDIPVVPDPQPDQSERQRLDAHTSSPACASCHVMLNPIGHAFDAFDELGVRRTVDSLGQPIDTRGRIQGLAAPDFNGTAELGRKLAAAPEVSACVVTQFFRFATGTEETPADACLREQLHAAFVSGGHKFRELVLALVASDAFRHRTP